LVGAGLARMDGSERGSRNPGALLAHSRDTLQGTLF
jgi:hypothetical protein